MELVHTVDTRPPKAREVAPVGATPDGHDDTRWSADDALTHLYAAHWRALVRLSYLLVRDQGVAEEVVQDAFVAVHRRWRSIADGDHALAYLRTAVVNGSRSALRRREVRRRWAEAGGPTAVDPAPLDHTARSAEDDALAADERRAVNAGLAALPTRQREVLVLRYHAGLSEAEIAETLGLSRGSVKSHAHRGLAGLRRALALPALEGATGATYPEEQS